MSDLTGYACQVGDEHCITCSDAATAMRVLELRQGAAVCVDEHDTIQVVAVELVAPVTPGDRLLVHAGVALSVLDGLQLDGLAQGGTG